MSSKFDGCKTRKMQNFLEQLLIDYNKIQLASLTIQVLKFIMVPCN